jgi:hypothetical protein
MDFSFMGPSLAETWGKRVATTNAQGQSLFNRTTIGGGRSGGGVPGGQTAGPMSPQNVGAEKKLAKSLQDQTGNYQQQMKARFEKLMGLATQFGASQQQQSADMLKQQMAAGQQDLVSRGLGNSTIVNSVNQSAQDLNQRRLADIGERSANLQMGVVQDTVPQAPDMGMYSQLFSQARTGGNPLIPSLPMFDLYGGQAAAPAPAPTPKPKKKKR